MAQLVKAMACKPHDLSLTPIPPIGPIWYKERTGSSKLSLDLHPYANTQTYKINKKIECWMW